MATEQLHNNPEPKPERIAEVTPLPQGTEIVSEGKQTTKREPIPLPAPNLSPSTSDGDTSKTNKTQSGNSKK